MYFSKNGLLGRLISETEDRAHQLAVIEYISVAKGPDNLSMRKAAYSFNEELREDIKKPNKDLSLRTTYRLNLINRYFIIIDVILSIVAVFMLIFTLMHFDSNDGDWAIAASIISLTNIAIGVLVSKIRKELF